MHLGRSQRGRDGYGKRYCFNHELLSIWDGLTHRSLKPILILGTFETKQPSCDTPKALLQHFFKISVISHILKPLEQGLWVAVGGELACNRFDPRIRRRLSPHQRSGIWESPVQQFQHLFCGPSRQQ